MEKNKLWNEFLKKGDIYSYLRYKRYERGFTEEVGDEINETLQDEGNSNKRDKL